MNSHPNLQSFFSSIRRHINFNQLPWCFWSRASPQHNAATTRFPDAISTPPLWISQKITWNPCTALKKCICGTNLHMWMTWGGKSTCIHGDSVQNMWFPFFFHTCCTYVSMSRRIEICVSHMIHVCITCCSFFQHTHTHTHLNAGGPENIWGLHRTATCELRSNNTQRYTSERKRLY